MTDRFEELISELGKYLDLDLHTDHNHACRLRIRDRVDIQLQMDAAQENLLMVSFATEIPPGKFRENVLLEALKANGLPEPSHATLSYLSQNNHLVLHRIFPLNLLNAERLAGLFGEFLEQVESWKQAIESGQSAPVSVSRDLPSKPFGLRP